MESMIRRKRPDLYPEFHVTFVKDKRIAEVTPVSLTDLGFANDVAYRDQPLEEISKEIALAIEEELIFLIEELLPRNIQDLFYKIGLDPRPAYWKAFEIAGNDLGLEKYTNHSDNRFNQFISHSQDGITELIDLGWTLTEIYENTCVTKTMILDVVYDNKKPINSRHQAWQKLDIEAALFKQKLEYEREVTLAISDKYSYTFDFIAYKSRQKILAVQLDDYIDFLMEVDTEYSETNAERYAILKAREQYCMEHNIILLRLEEDEYMFNDVSWGKLIYKVLSDPTYARKHDEEVVAMLREMADCEDDWD